MEVITRYHSKVILLIKKRKMAAEEKSESKDLTKRRSFQATTKLLLNSSCRFLFSLCTVAAKWC